MDRNMNKVNSNKNRNTTGLNFRSKTQNRSMDVLESLKKTSTYCNTIALRPTILKNLKIVEVFLLNSKIDFLFYLKKLFF